MSFEISSKLHLAVAIAICEADDASGNFEIVLTIENPSFTTVLIPNANAYGHLLIESGMSYEVAFDLNSTVAMWEIRPEGGGWDRAADFE